jgi:hypothetical protein
MRFALAAADLESLGWDEKGGGSTFDELPGTGCDEGYGVTSARAAKIRSDLYLGEVAG